MYLLQTVVNGAVADTVRTRNVRDALTGVIPAPDHLLLLRLQCAYGGVQSAQRFFPFDSGGRICCRVGEDLALEIVRLQTAGVSAVFVIIVVLRFVKAFVENLLYRARLLLLTGLLTPQAAPHSRHGSLGHTPAR